jgi:hypothetical protein
VLGEGGVPQGAAIVSPCSSAIPHLYGAYVGRPKSIWKFYA